MRTNRNLASSRIESRDEEYALSHLKKDEIKQKGVLEMKKRLAALSLVLLIFIVTAVPAFADVEATEMRHSVVRIEVGFQGDAGFEWMSAGTGFFIGKTGEDPSYLLTNYHVIDLFLDLGKGQQNDFSTFFFWWLINVEGMSQEDIEGLLANEDAANSVINTLLAKQYSKFAGNLASLNWRAVIRVFFDNNDSVEAYLVDNGDSSKDMALLKLDKPTDKRVPLKISVPSEKMVGHDVTAIGYPGASSNFVNAVSDKGENDSTVTRGTISRLATEEGTGRHLVQYDAAINHGNSGGPLILNETGAVIALNTWGNKLDSNMNFGVSMEEVVPMLKNNNVVFDTLNYPAPTPQTTKTTTTTSTSTTTTTKPSIPVPPHPNMMLVIGAVAVIAAAAIAFLVLRKKPDPTPVPKPIPTPGPETGPAPDSDDSLYRVQCLKGALGNKRVMIPKSRQIIMGRNADSGIRFPENTKGVSGRHCAVYYDKGAVYITDLGSSFGTFIEPGQRLTSQQSVQLPVGKKFWLGSENEVFVIDKKK